jgi:hypothetical protein
MKKPPGSVTGGFCVSAGIVQRRGAGITSRYARGDDGSQTLHLSQIGRTYAQNSFLSARERTMEIYTRIQYTPGKGLPVKSLHPFFRISGNFLLEKFSRHLALDTLFPDFWTQFTVQAQRIMQA